MSSFALSTQVEMIQTVLPWLLLAWLTLEAIWDLRNQNVPVWFSLVMLIPALTLTFLVSPWAAVLVAVSLVSTEVRHQLPMAGTLGMYLTVGMIAVVAPEYLPLVIGWGALMIAWQLGGIGGADALAGLSLLLFFPSWEMLSSIVAGILIWSVALLILRYGRSAGLRLWTVASTRAAGTQAAGIRAYALAALIFGAMGCF